MFAVVASVVGGLVSGYVTWKVVGAQEVCLQKRVVENTEDEAAVEEAIVRATGMVDSARQQGMTDAYVSPLISFQIKLEMDALSCLARGRRLAAIAAKISKLRREMTAKAFAVGMVVTAFLIRLAPLVKRMVKDHLERGEGKAPLAFAG